jgi:hypothetical protein
MFSWKLILKVASLKNKNQGCGSGFGIRIRILEGKNDPQK